ncbi:MAG: TIGR02530 family flagellar biosynthesis protein [Candidatus Kapaibacterium sp.]
MELNGIQLPFVPVHGGHATVPTPPASTPPRTPFADILDSELQNLRFSSHAQARLTSRDIRLSDEDVKRIGNAATKASDKGAKDSLVMLRDMAFIVSVRNRTVITALNGEQARTNVFTNIDSAVVA